MAGGVNRGCEHASSVTRHCVIEELDDMMLYMSRINDFALESSDMGVVDGALHEAVVQAVKRSDWWRRGVCATAALHELSDGSSSGIIHVGIRHHFTCSTMAPVALKSVKKSYARDWTRFHPAMR